MPRGLKVARRPLGQTTASGIRNPLKELIQLSLGASGGRLGRRPCRLGIARESGARMSVGPSEPGSGLTTGGRCSGRGPTGLGPVLRGSGRRPGVGTAWRRSCCPGCRSEGRSDSRFPGAKVISSSMISSHCGSVRSRSGTDRSSRSRRRGSWGGDSFMATL